MTRDELAGILAAERIRPDAYALGDVGRDECYVLDDAGGTWEVFYSERGQKGSLRSFRREEDACRYLLDLLRSDPTTRA